MQPRIASSLSCLGVVSLLVLTLTGCGSRPDRLLNQALASEKAAQAARARYDPAGAQSAADRADAAVSELRQLVDTDKSGSQELPRKVALAETAARSAREHAGFAVEETQRRDIMNSLKVRAYQKGRALFLAAALPPLAAAAENAGKRGTNDLSALERSLAEQGWNIVSVISARPRLPDGAPDWPGTASDLSRWSTNPPVEFRAFLGLAFVMLGRSDFALAEFESVDADALNTTNALAIYHGGRALLYSLQGWTRLAAPEAEAFCRQAQLPGGSSGGDRWLALFHACLAAEALQKRDYAKMDAAIAQSLRAWPNNPLAVYLTGERLAANGEWEKAADSLEAQAAGTDSEWIAQRLAQRARDLRDGKGGSKAFVLDAQFVLQFAAQSAARSARDSASTGLGKAFDQARAFSRDFADKLSPPGDASKEDSSPRQPPEQPAEN